jgi:hypothetical protein
MNEVRVSTAVLKRFGRWATAAAVLFALLDVATGTPFWRSIGDGCAAWVMLAMMGFSGYVAITWMQNEEDHGDR